MNEFMHMTQNRLTYGELVCREGSPSCPLDHAEASSVGGLGYENPNLNDFGPAQTDIGVGRALDDGINHIEAISTNLDHIVTSRNVTRYVTRYALLDRDCLKGCNQ